MNEHIPHLLKEQEVADILSMKVSTLRRWRWSGDGPAFLKIGEAVRYDPQTIRMYIASSKRTSTSEFIHVGH